MTPIWLFLVFLCAPNCSGRYFADRIFRKHSRMLWQDIPSLDAACVDDKNYADKCPEKAAIKDYCKYHSDFMQKNCPKSCGFCSSEVKKPPAPVVCADDENYADKCPEKAAIKDYCKHHSDFMQKNCPKSCGFCSSGRFKPPSPIGCIDDANYADACPEKAAIPNYCQMYAAFMRKNCPYSCGFCSSAAEQTPQESTMKLILVFAALLLFVGMCEGYIQQLPLNTETRSKERNIPAPEICESDLPKWAQRCPKWAQQGLCEDEMKTRFMEHYCRKSCKLPCKPEPGAIQNPKPPSPPAFCIDYDINCDRWKSMGACQSNNVNIKSPLNVYCGVTCDACKAPNPAECHDKRANCKELKREGFCNSTDPIVQYEVKSNCVVTCGFCVPA
ncbi:zinc metalloproteinase nas-15-like [Acropora muricata]|uniref:zinc metalloproteinase nas-15-like n=1 Tax=Acropora muricata TaxID=159855 RepID=UPI0034E3C9D9